MNQAEHCREPGGLKHIDVVEYNPQCLWYKIHRIDSNIKAHVIGCPGTMMHNRTPGFVDAVWKQQSKNYLWLHHGAPQRNTKWSSRNCGCSIALAKKLFKETDIRHIYTSEEIGPKCKGRGLMVELKRRGLFHLAVLCLYLPNEKGIDARDCLKELLKWAGKHADALPDRCTLFLPMDGNLKLGLLEGIKPPEDDATGTVGLSWNNTSPHGHIMRDWLNHHHMAASSTFVAAGNFPTYFYHDDKSTRIDFVGAPKTLTPLYGHVLRRLSYYLQSSKKKLYNVDHAAVLLRFSY